MMKINKIRFTALALLILVLPLGYKFAVLANVVTAFRTGNIFDGGNRTDRVVDWQDPVPADPGEVIEFRVQVINDSTSPVSNTNVRFELATQRSNSPQAKVFISGTGSATVTDTVTVNVSGNAQAFQYIPGHGRKFGPGCLQGCDLPDSLITDGVSLGTVNPGATNSYQLAFKAYVTNVVPPSPTATPTMSPSPSPSPTVRPTATPTKTPMPTKSPTATPMPTKTPVVTQSPTVAPTPTQTPTSPPELKSKLIICKYEDKNGNGIKDSEDRKISWKFNYSVNNLNQSDRYESTSHWWNLLKSGCVSDEIEAGKLITINEESKAGWELTGIYSNNQKISGGNYVFQTKAGETKEIWFLNKVNIAATPVPGEPNSCNGTCGSNINCQSGLFCHQGYCRKPECSSDSTCGCAASPTPTTPAVLGAKTPTDLPKTGFGTAGIAVALLTSAKVGHYLYKRFKLI